ncbi:acyl-CoA N-acyltransferase [Penicillium citrinum]|uniref:Acyl-CoA N-acyltransferase n=1 Tax=Penicillium citrinum TaxID=5077 RepID=A0A9W9NYM6_PENCI|nr:acyl-CoA N-acyltransferase [Penicillium citrinum]KAJ5231840.1 acyl-CoA N-acyltransferase [Penicillium citrinum]
MDSSTRTLEPLYEADIPTAVSLLFAMIHYTEERKLFADIPGVRQWWHDTIRTDLLQDRNQI